MYIVVIKSTSNTRFAILRPVAETFAEEVGKQ